VAKKTVFYKENSFEISYEMLNPKADIDFIVLHGWGSNKSLMKQAFGEYLKNFRHIYIDLPGFGNSSAPIKLDSYDYAKIIELFLTQIGAKKEIVLGHSFGGKVATLLNPKLLVLLSSAGIYLPKPLKVKAKIALYKVLKLFGLAKFREFFIADDAKKLTPQMYETFKTVVNEDFSDEFKKFSNQALICWGKNDSATPLKAGKMINEYIKNSRFIPYNGDHYFFLNHKKDISQNIEETF
jgi:pimeloyl-ACP methyl ester carboxylesterase